jgi:L-fucose mutarotase
MMLKGIPTSISPHLMQVLLSMGHGDELVLADGNFPSSSHGHIVVDCSGHTLPELLDAILRFFPLDYAVPQAVFLMAAPDHLKPDDLWCCYEEIIKSHEPGFTGFTTLEKPAFYARAKTAYAIIASGETARFANLILRKGVVHPDQIPGIIHREVRRV